MPEISGILRTAKGGCKGTLYVCSTPSGNLVRVAKKDEFLEELGYSEMIDAFHKDKVPSPPAPSFRICFMCFPPQVPALTPTQPPCIQVATNGNVDGKDDKGDGNDSEMSPTEPALQPKHKRPRMSAQRQSGSPPVSP